MAKTVPITYLCSITHEIMKEPVMDPEGNTYERSAIEEWLRREQKSPITRSPLQISELRPNRALRDLIEEFTSTNPDAVIRTQSSILRFSHKCNYSYNISY